jgi:hypothetical protein
MSEQAAEAALLRTVARYLLERADGLEALSWVDVTSPEDLARGVRVEMHQITGEQREVPLRRDARPAVPLHRTFTATWTRPCSACDRDIVPLDAVRADGKGGWRHATHESGPGE